MERYLAVFDYGCDGDTLQSMFLTCSTNMDTYKDNKEELQEEFEFEDDNELVMEKVGEINSLEDKQNFFNQIRYYSDNDTMDLLYEINNEITNDNFFNGYIEKFIPSPLIYSYVVPQTTKFVYQWIKGGELIANILEFDTLEDMENTTFKLFEK